jgi:hypothetical protein
LTSPIAAVLVSTWRTIATLNALLAATDVERLRGVNAQKLMTLPADVPSPDPISDMFNYEIRQRVPLLARLQQRASTLAMSAANPGSLRAALAACHERTAACCTQHSGATVKSNSRLQIKGERVAVPPKRDSDPLGRAAAALQLEQWAAGFIVGRISASSKTERLPMETK